MGSRLQESVEQPFLVDALLRPQDQAKKGNPYVSDPTDIHQEAKADPWDGSLGQRVEEFPYLPLQARPPEYIYCLSLRAEGDFPICPFRRGLQKAVMSPATG